MDFKTVRIGKTIWMARNFNGGERHGSAPNGKFWNRLWYGSLYTFSDAKANCPNGWHIPTEREIEELNAFIGSLKNPKRFLLRKFHWVLSGMYDCGMCRYKDFTHYGHFWFIKDWNNSPGEASQSKLYWSKGDFRFSGNFSHESHEYSVRYVKDKR